MKYSKYNIQINISKTIDIIYNSLSDKFLFLKKGSLQENVESIDPPLIANLVLGGFIVEDDIDETQLCIKKAREIEKDMTKTHLILNPTINCNFRCWYCYEKHVPSKMSEKTIKCVEKLIENSCKRSRALIISFFGGEPLLYYDDVILPILKRAKDIACKEGIVFTSNCTTNGSLFNLSRIIELKKLNFNFAQITLDGNREIHNKTRHYANGIGSYDRIIENIKELVRHHIHITLRINYTKENIKSVLDIPSDFNDITLEEKTYISVSFHKVWQEAEVHPDEIDRAINAFQKVGFTASKFIFGQYCYGDLRSSAVINYNGDVFKCTAVNFEETERDGYLNEDGDIIWENDRLEKRMNSKFSNKPCLECNILPLCHGGCSSKPLQFGGDYCILNFDETEKINVVLEKLLYNIKFRWNRMIELNHFSH